MSNRLYQITAGAVLVVAPILVHLASTTVPHAEEAEAAPAPVYSPVAPAAPAPQPMPQPLPQQSIQPNADPMASAAPSLNVDGIQPVAIGQSGDPSGSSSETGESSESSETGSRTPATN